MDSHLYPDYLVRRLLTRGSPADGSKLGLFHQHAILSPSWHNDKQHTPAINRRRLPCILTTLSRGTLVPGRSHCMSCNFPNLQVPPNYDSLLGKLIVWAEDRNQAIARMKRALSETVISGVPTTIDYHQLILDTKDFRDGNVDTGAPPAWCLQSTHLLVVMRRLSTYAA